jgi:hypothetical protein
MANLVNFVLSGNGEVQYLIKQVSPCLALESVRFHFIISIPRRCTAFRREADTTLHLARSPFNLVSKVVCKLFLNVSELPSRIKLLAVGFEELQIRGLTTALDDLSGGEHLCCINLVEISFPSGLCVTQLQALHLAWCIFD